MIKYDSLWPSYSNPKTRNNDFDVLVSRTTMVVIKRQQAVPLILIHLLYIHAKHNMTLWGFWKGFSKWTHSAAYSALQLLQHSKQGWWYHHQDYNFYRILNYKDDPSSIIIRITTKEKSININKTQCERTRGKTICASKSRWTNIWHLTHEKNQNQMSALVYQLYYLTVFLIINLTWYVDLWCTIPIADQKYLLNFWAWPRPPFSPHCIKNRVYVFARYNNKNKSR